MSRLILFFILYILAFVNINAKKMYVEMEYHKNSIKLDDGSNKKPQTIKDENGRDLKFRSLIGALNYMSQQGWELIDTKSVTSGHGLVMGGYGSGSSDTKVYYIFFKEVSDQELEEVVNNSFKE